MNGTSIAIERAGLSIGRGGLTLGGARPGGSRSNVLRGAGESVAERVARVDDEPRVPRDELPIERRVIGRHEHRVEARERLRVERDGARARDGRARGRRRDGDVRIAERPTVPSPGFSG